MPVASAARRLPAPPSGVPIQRSLDGLAPAFRAKVERLLEAVPHSQVAETLRTEDRQQYLFGFGRFYDDGRGIVTHSETALDTWHHYGLAADLVHRSLGYTAPRAWWQQLGVAARALGLEWGGDWPSFRDYPHVQWAPMRRSPSPSAAQLLAAGGPARVWAVVKADGPTQSIG